MENKQSNTQILSPAKINFTEEQVEVLRNVRSDGDTFNDMGSKMCIL